MLGRKLLGIIILLVNLSVYAYTPITLENRVNANDTVKVEFYSRGKPQPSPNGTIQHATATIDENCNWPGIPKRCMYAIVNWATPYPNTCASTFLLFVNPEYPAIYLVFDKKPGGPCGYDVVTWDKNAIIAKVRK